MKIIFTVTDPGIIDDYEDIHPDLVIQDFYSNFREWRDSGDFSVGVSKSDKPTPQSTGDKSPQICPHYQKAWFNFDDGEKCIQHRCGCQGKLCT